MSSPLTSNNPMIVYPSIKDGYPDFGFASGVLANDSEHWNPFVAGTSTATLVTGVGEQLGSALYLHRTAGNYCGVNMQTLRFLPNMTPGSITPSYLLRIKCTAQTGNDSLLVYVDFYTSASAYISTSAIGTIQLGVDLAADGVWRIFKIPASAVPSNCAAIGGFFGTQDAGSSTYDLYVDWITFGHLLDFSQLGPSSKGAYIDQKMPRQRVYERTKQNAIDGTPEVQVWDAGWLETSLKSTPFDDAARTSVLAFNSYALRGAPYTIMENPANLTRNYLPRAIAAAGQRGSGIKQIAAGLHVWEWKSEEVA